MFKACLKKEFLETCRTKNFYIILASAVGMSLFAILTVVLMEFILSYMPLDDMGEFAMLFNNNYQISFMYFASFISTYFLIIILFFFCGSISQEINKEQWILPMNSGIKPSNLIGAKIISVKLMVFVSYIISAGIHLLLTVLFSKPIGDYGVTQLLLNYVYLLVFVLFITIMIVTINAISKKRWVPVVIVLITLILLPPILEVITIAGTPLVSYTPLEFFQMTSSTVTRQHNTLQWICMFASTAVIAGGLAFWAVNSGKIKGKKTNYFIGAFSKKSKKGKQA